MRIHYIQALHYAIGDTWLRQNNIDLHLKGFQPPEVELDQSVSFRITPMAPVDGN